jgi:hypothetical protein
MIQEQWYADWRNIVTLTSWMANNSYDASDVAYAVEKPWKFEEEFGLATAELQAG